MVQQWHWFQPFVMCRKPCQTGLDITENPRGQPMAPAYPVEWFANLSIFHRKQLEETIKSLRGQDVRFAEELPHLDKDKFGQQLSDADFQQRFARVICISTCWP